MLRTQPNFVVHVAAAAIAIALAVGLGLSANEVAVVVLAIAVVLVVECVNTVLETICNLVSPEFHPLVKRAKDVSAAAVLIAATAAVAIALLLFVPRVLGMVK